MFSNKSEIQIRPFSLEKLKTLEKDRNKKQKVRKNDEARHDMHYEMEVDKHDVFPDDLVFDMRIL